MRRWFPAVLATFVVAVLALPARAADDIQVDPAEMVKGFQKDCMGQVDDAASKLIELAEAVPAGKYAWRPGKGVRSTYEVYMHVAAANYLLPTYLGIKPPDGVDPVKLEKQKMTKAQAVDALRKSFVHVRRAIAAVPDADLAQEVTFFGQPSSKRTVMLVFVSHAHEHLGQSIAYARMNGVVPPWTAREQAEAAGPAGK